MKKLLCSVTVASLAVMALPLSGAVVLNPATNVIAGDFGSNGVAASFQSIADITIVEGVANDIGVQSGRVLILDAPNWRFKPGVGSVSVSDPTDISSISLEVLDKQLRLTLSCSGTSRLDTITISGLQVRPNIYVDAMGRIRRAGGNGDTAVIAGLNGNTPVAYLQQPAPVVVESPLTIVAMTNQVPVVQFSVLPNVNYTLECSSDFVSWSPVVSVMRATNSLIQYGDTAGAGVPCRYYRLSH